MCVTFLAAVPSQAGEGAAGGAGGADIRLGPVSQTSLVIGGSSACPRPDAVWSALETLIPWEHLEGHARTLSPSSSTVEILDLGLRYRVIAGGRVREYKDDAHDCDHRARVAAVFVALALAPGYFGQPTTPPVAVAPVPPPVPQPPPVLPSRHAFRVDVGASYMAGLSVDHHAAPGVTARLAMAWATWGFVVGMTVPLPTETTVNGLAIREFRAPVDAGVRLRLRTNPVEIAGEGGLSVAWLHDSAPDLALSTARSTIEWGLRAGLTVRLSSTTLFSPFVTAHVEFVPRPTALWAVPQGHLGDSPMFWAGLTAGASLGW